MKVARNRFKELKRTKVVYMTYVLTFPDTEVWIKQDPFSAHDMAWKLQQMIKEHARTESEWKHRAMALWKAGECWWKDEAGCEHLVMIEDKKRETRWGLNQKGMATFKQIEAPDESPTA